ncbi:HNH endonuclease signature motif containing protein [Propioniciclava sinopodophylli]|uniref:HNH endonuclease signature motif containing protein n=1 Tax=Propioniciclava sinopodophylli TaxID=1837344 RepID=UPI00249033B5|nr:HNH endonuclease signature motif containing protein [Propioniciclava sinopodophylli]
MDQLTPTATALAGARSLLAGIDHAGRRRLDAEARLALVTEVVALGRQVEALRAVLIAEADRAKAAEAARGTSIKTLLAVSSKVTASEAAAWVYGGQEMTAHPKVADAALSGEVSVAQARSIDRVLGELPATLTAGQRAEAEQILLDKAALVDAQDLAKQTRTVLQLVAPEVDAVEDELSRLDAQRKQAWAGRSLVFTNDRRGSVLFKGQLPTLEGEAFKRLVEAHAISNRRAMEQAADRHGVSGLRSFEQRTADGLIALVAGRTPEPARFPEPADGRAPEPVEGSSVEASTSSATRPRAPEPGQGSSSRAGASASFATRTSPPARPTVVVTLSFDDLLNRVEQAGVLASGEQVTAGELRRLACDANIVPIVLGSASQPLDVGRDQRLVTPAIRKALEQRDKACAFPGCRVTASGCEAHHIIPWWMGGETALSNMVLLCPHHHGTVEPHRFFDRSSPPTRWTVDIAADGHPVFTPPSRPGQPVSQTRVRHQRRVDERALPTREPTPDAPQGALLE